MTSVTGVPGPPPSSTPRSRARLGARLGARRAAVALVALTTLAGAACSAGGGAGSGAGSGESGSADGGGRPASAAQDAPAAARDGVGGAAAFADGTAAESLDDLGRAASDQDAAGTVSEQAAIERKVISTGNVVLRADDVAETRLEVLGVVDRLRGEVSEEETATDDDGEVKRSRMVLRVPTAAFDEAVEGLSDVAELVSAQTGSEDVTTKVLDVAIRVRVQRRSIRRIELLLDRAQSIRDIVAIEAQLTRRQAALASLEKQQDYLADQTSMATITVSLQRTVEEEVRPKAEEAGFLAGLSAGWGGLVSFAVGAATVTGALLPFLALALLLAIPGWPLARWLRRLARSRHPAAG
ncbi:DUF4349 domain-containing protein [Nocardioides sp. SYSU DS0663]|uniref:DUF4349 domain-containing protein n=1 Tax=Nocardioides sp. SYSU DS0663 TaxID=3416445 RepID=UPI003F4BF018